MLGATAADGIFFVLTYYGVATRITPGERNLLFVLGGALLLYLAFSILRNARRSKADTASLPPSSRWPSSSIGRSPFLLGLSIGLTNPYQLGWWIAVGAAMVADFGESIAVGFFVGILLWTVTVTGIVRAGATRYQRLAPAIAYGSAALMVAFGCWFLAVGLSTTIP